MPAVAEGEAAAVADHVLGPRHREVHPPETEREPDARDGEHRGVDGPAGLAVHQRVERGDDAEDDLAEHDDHQQPVALGDVVRVPWRVDLALGDVGPASSSANSGVNAANVVTTGRSATASAIQPTWAIPIVAM
jgi:hypothetical protein